MLTRIKTSLDKIIADEALIENTQNNVLSEMNRISGAECSLQSDSLNVNEPSEIFAVEFKRVALNTEKKSKGISRKAKMLYASAASFAILFIAGYFSFDFYFTEVSFVDMDVNPSIELKLNKLDRVIGTYAFNEEGKLILAETDVSNKKMDEAIDMLITEIGEQGYIVEDGLITLVLQTNDKSKEKTLLNRIRKLNSVVAKKNELYSDIEIFSVDEQVKKNADELDISCGKYLAYTELKEVDPEMSVEECKRSTIQEMKAETKRHHEGHGNQSGNGNHDGIGNQNNDANNNGAEGEKQSGNGNHDGNMNGDGHKGNSSGAKGKHVNGSQHE